MQDQRIVAEGAQAVVGPDATLAFTQSYPGSVAIGASASVGDIMFQEYTPAVQQTVEQLIESVNIVSQETIPTLFESFNLVTEGLVSSFGDVIAETSGTFGKSLEAVSGAFSQSLGAVSEATGKTAETTLKVTEVLGEKLRETELGQAAILPGMAKYLLIAVAVILIAGKVWK